MRAKIGSQLNTMLAMSAWRATRRTLSMLLALAGVLVVSTFVVPARASVIDWNFNFQLDNGDTGSGTFETQDTPAGGPYLITSIDNGELNGTTAFTLLSPNGSFNDNLLYASGQPFDMTGLGFQTADGVQWAIWLNPEGNSLFWCNNSVSGDNHYCAVTEKIDPSGVVSLFIVDPTPLPGALPLFAGGLGVIGLLVRRRKRNAAALAAA